MVQTRAARYVTNIHHNRSSVTDMLDQLGWESLDTRRSKLQLTMLYKIVHDLIDILAAEYLTPSTSRTRASHSHKFNQLSSSTDTYKYSFITLTIPTWNRLPATIAEAPSLVSFKRELSSTPF